MKNNEDGIIGVASVYTRKYYFNSGYAALPHTVKDEIKHICVFYAEKLHCEFSIKFGAGGDIFFETFAEEEDYNFDEIGAKLDTDRLAKQKKELFNSLSLWYRVFVHKENNGEINEN